MSRLTRRGRSLSRRMRMGWNGPRLDNQRGDQAGRHDGGGHEADTAGQTRVAILLGHAQVWPAPAGTARDGGRRRKNPAKTRKDLLF